MEQKKEDERGAAEMKKNAGRDRQQKQVKSKVDKRIEVREKAW